MIVGRGGGGTSLNSMQRSNDGKGGFNVVEDHTLKL